MRHVSRAAFVLSILLGTFMSVGCSDNSTAPAKQPPTSTDLEHVWSQRFGDASSQLVYDVATDASGNIIIAGYFEGSVNFGGHILASAGQEDIFVAKYAPDGTHIWSYRFGDSDDQYGFTVTVDASGNVIQAGMFFGRVDFGNGPLTSAGTSDIFVAKFNSSGAPLWSKRFGDSSTQEATSVTADATGNVIITGAYLGTVDFGSGPLPSSGNHDIFLAKFNSEGVHLWSDHFGDGDSQFGRRVAADASGNIILVGEFYGRADFGDGSLLSAGGRDICMAKFASDGSHSWSKRFGDADNQAAPRVTVDASGNIIIAGYFEGTVDFGGGTLTSAGSADLLVAKFDSSGNHLWSAGYGDSSFQHAYGVAADASGNIIMSGYFTGEVDFGGGTLSSAGDYDVFLARFDPDGAHIWSDRFGDSQSQYSQNVTTDASGNAIMVGSFQGSIDFGSGDLTSAGLYDIFVVKFEL